MIRRCRGACGLRVSRTFVSEETRSWVVRVQRRLSPTIVTNRIQLLPRMGALENQSSSQDNILRHFGPPLTRFESDGQLFWVIVPCNTCIRMTPDISTERLGIIDRGLAPTFAHQCNCIRDLATDASRQIHMGPT